MMNFLKDLGNSLKGLNSFQTFGLLLLGGLAVEKFSASNELAASSQEKAAIDSQDFEEK